MRSKSPENRRRFENYWDEILYLYYKVLYWFYPVRSRARALRFSRRLERLLRLHKVESYVAKGQECWSLIYEVRGDLRNAIKHRRREISLIKRVRVLAPRVCGYEVADLCDRLELLAILYHEAGDLKRAIAALKESRMRSRRAGIKFDGEDLMRDYSLELKPGLASHQRRP